MEVKFAEHEKRNLGRITYEINVEKGDGISDLKETLAGLADAEYIVVKTPVNEKELLWGMEELGFTFIETQIMLYIKTEEYRKSGWPLHDDKDITVKTANEDGINRVKREIEKRMFINDRVALDKHFTLDDAARRYVLWTEDVLKNSGEVVEVFLKGEPVGFFTYKPGKDKIWHGVITGMYETARGKGLGAALITEMVRYAMADGNELLITNISSNNRQTVNAHILAGFLVKEMIYVYVKHNIANQD